MPIPDARARCRRPGFDDDWALGTAKFGARESDGALSEDRLRELARLDELKMCEIKLSQGAKPGKGGILPAAKVTPEIAAIRGIPAGRDAISPNRHPEIDSCGVKEPRALRRHRARIVQATGRSIPLDEPFPPPCATSVPGHTERSARAVPKR